MYFKILYLCSNKTDKKMKLELIEIQNAKQTIDSKNIKGISTTLENNVLHVLENNSLIIKLSQNDWGYCTISKNATEIVSKYLFELFTKVRS